MSERLLKALARAGRSIHNPFFAGGEYVRPKNGDAQKDFQRITGDMKVIAKNLTNVADRELRRHVK
jgi:hypothetical protein